MLVLYWAEVLLVVVFLLSVITKNFTMIIATAIVLIIKKFHGESILLVIESYGITIGVIIITMSLLAPILLGRYQLNEVKSIMFNQHGFIGLIAGIIVALLGAQGVRIGPINTNLTLGVVFGTFIGVSFFKGAAVGPLIGTGIGYVLVSILSRMRLL